eukprot:1177264-Prorocentrum_minimum.AAC.1
MHDSVAAHLIAPPEDTRGAAGEVAPVGGVRHHSVAPLPLRHPHHLRETEIGRFRVQPPSQPPSPQPPSFGSRVTSQPSGRGCSVQTF